MTLFARDWFVMHSIFIWDDSFIYYHYLFIYYLQVRTEEVRCSHSQTGLVSVSALPSSGGGEQSPNVWESTLNLEINGVFEAFETLKRNHSDSAHF